MILQRVFFLASIPVFFATTLAWSQTGAPPKPDADDEGITATVVVTGSRIARPEVERLQPTQIVTGERFDEKGYANVIDALNDLPAFGVPAASAKGSQSNSSFAVAQSFSDFFSLGSQRTLTLVNGRRFVSSNTSSIFGPTDSGQQVDLNAIPTKLIDRVEVIAVGGAPIYGSDAIAGTINVITKKDYQGFDVDALSGIAEQGDAFNYRVRALAGTNFAADRGNVVLNTEYVKTRGLLYSDRKVLARELFFDSPQDPNSPYSQVLYKDFRYAIFTRGGLPMFEDFLPVASSITDASGNLLAFGPGGALVPYDPGVQTPSFLTASGGDGLAFTDISNLLAPQERMLATTFVNFQISDRLRAFGEGWFAKTHGTRLRDQPVYNTWLFDDAGTTDGNLIISTDNPFLSAAARTTLIDGLNAAGADPSVFYLARANTDLVSGEARAVTDLYRFVAGLEGDFNLGERAYGWEVSANYGRSLEKSKEPNLVQQNFVNAIDAAIDPSSGEIVCAASLTPGGVVSAPVSTLADQCAPLNLFGDGSPSQAARDYVTHIARTTSTITQRIFTADVHGPLFDLPAGAVQGVLGYENRRETSEFVPDEFFAGAFGRSIPIGSIDGAFETDEAFSELLIPLVSPQQGMPLVNRFEIEGAARYIDHSIAGGDTTWTAGLRFAPIEDILFRGNKTFAIRSPAITEAFNPTVQAFQLADDPCDARFIDTGPDPERRAANCAAAGIPPGFVSNIVNATAPISVSGNPDLLNEEADSQTWGVVLQPRFIPRLNLAVDWVKIDLRNAIVQLDAQLTLNACYDSPNPAGSQQCAAIDRDPDGQVAFIRTGYGNAGSKKFEGVTASMSYDFAVPAFGHGEPGSFGSVNVDLRWFDMRRLETRVGLGDIDTEDGEIGNSHHQGALNLGYKLNRVDWQTGVTYFGSAVWDADEPAGTRDVPGVHGWFVFDTSLGYKLNDHLGARLVVNNLFDKLPPAAIPAGGGTVTYFEGILGRRYALSFNYAF